MKLLAMSTRSPVWWWLWRWLSSSSMDSTGIRLVRNSGMSCAQVYTVSIISELAAASFTRGVPWQNRRRKWQIEAAEDSSVNNSRLTRRDLRSKVFTRGLIMPVPAVGFAALLKISQAGRYRVFNVHEHTEIVLKGCAYHYVLAGRDLMSRNGAALEAVADATHDGDASCQGGVKNVQQASHLVLDVLGERLDGLGLDVLVEVLLGLPLLVRVQEQVVGQRLRRTPACQIGCEPFT